MKRSGFTLMELLLVVAILAIVAAVAAPQFFRTSEVAMEDARIAQLKANHAAIRAAINMAVWDDHNNPKVTTQQKFRPAPDGEALPGFADTDYAYIRKLINRGFLQQNAAYYENEKGEKIQLGVKNVGETAADPYSKVASAPVFMENTKLFKIYDQKGIEIDQLLREGKTWVDIWATVK